MASSHDDDDVAKRQTVLRKLYIASLLCACFLVVEVVGGLLSHSLAILSDAAHLFADLAGFLVAIAASYLASLPATSTHTFGLKRTESLAALFSMVSLAFVSVALAYEAVRRLILRHNRAGGEEDDGVDGPLMTAIASFGILVNILLAVVLGESHVHMPGFDHGHDHCHDHHGHDGHNDTGNSTKSGHCNSSKHDEEGAGGHSHSEEHQHHPSSHGHDHDHGHNHTARNNGHGHDHHDHSTPSETTKLLTPSASSNHHECDRDHHPHHDEKHQNVNLQAAYLHVMADLAQSVAVCIGGFVIWVKPEWDIVDPILTLGFCILVLWGAWGVIRSAMAVLLEETPSSVDWKKVHEDISNVEGVSNVHDLHIWSISHGQVALSVHATSSSSDAIRNINQVCKRYGIDHPTIQVQSSEGSCPTCQEDEHGEGRGCV